MYSRVRLNRWWIRVALLAVLIARAVPAVVGAPDSSDRVQFRRDIAPVLIQKCLACHEPAKAKGQYSVHTVNALLAPGRSKEKPVVPGSPEQSLLYRLLKAKDPDDRMPQKDDPLPAEQIALIARWIEQGAEIGDVDPNQPLASIATATSQPPPPAHYSRPVPVLALAFSPDGRELAAGGYHEVIFWNPDDGALLRRITNIAQQVQAIGFSPDGRTFVVAAGTPGRAGEVKLFDASSGRLLRTLGNSGDLMLAASFSHDGTRVAFAGADNALQVFDLVKGQPVFRTEQHADWIFTAEFSPDDQHVVTASRDKTVRLVSTARGELEQTYAGHSDSVFAAAFCTDGKRLVSAGRDRRIHLWNSSEAKKLGDAGPFDAEILAMVARSNRVFSASANGEVREHRLVENRLEPVRTYRGHTDYVRSLSVHEDGQGGGQLAAAAHNGLVRIWDLKTGELRLEFLAAPGLAKH